MDSGLQKSVKYSYAIHGKDSGRGYHTCSMILHPDLSFEYECVDSSGYDYFITTRIAATGHFSKAATQDEEKATAVGELYLPHTTSGASTGPYSFNDHTVDSEHPSYVTRLVLEADYCINKSYKDWDDETNSWTKPEVSETATWRAAVVADASKCYVWTDLLMPCANGEFIAHSFVLGDVQTEDMYYRRSPPPPPPPLPREDDSLTWFVAFLQSGRGLKRSISAIA